MAKQFVGKQFIVYCAKSVSHLTVDNLRAGIDADFPALAASFGILSRTAKRTAKLLRVESATKPEGVRFHLVFRSVQFIPIRIYVWADPERRQLESSAASGRLEGVTGRGPSLICKHLVNLEAIVAIELEERERKRMGEVFARRAAEFVASTADGLFRDPNDDWWAMEKGVAVRIDAK